MAVNVLSIYLEILRCLLLHHFSLFENFFLKSYFDCFVSVLSASSELNESTSAPRSSFSSFFKRSIFFLAVES